MKRDASITIVVFLSVALLVFGGYLLTLSPDLTWANFGGDGGELITAVVTLGVPHPPGYPTYVLLGKLVSLLPIGTVAFRLNLFSAVCVALAAGVTSMISIAWPGACKEPAACRLPLAAWLFAFTPLVWGQALIAEVYGLNVLLVSLFLWALLGKRPYLLTGLLLGLSLTTHLTSALLLPLALALVPLRQWPSLGLGLLVGLTPYLLLPLLARGNSPVVWGDPTTLAGWWWLVSGRIYHANAFALPPAAWLPRLWEWAWVLVVVAGWLVTGGWQQIIGQWRLAMVNGQLSMVNSQFPIPNSQFIVLPPAGLFFTFCLYLLYAFFYNTPDAAVLLLPALLILALLLTPLLSRLRGWGWLLPLTLLLLNFSGQNLRGDVGVRPYADQLLRSVPENAILLTPGNETIFALWYFQAVEGMRPDVTLVDENLFAFTWYRARLQGQYPPLRALAADDVAQFVQENGRFQPVLRVDLATSVPRP